MPVAAKAVVAKKKTGRPKTSTRDDVTAKLSRAVVGKAKAIALYRGLPGGAAELLTDLVVKPIDKAYLQMLRELDAN